MGGKESDLGGFAKKDGAACFLFQRHAGWARRGSAAPGLDARGVFVPAMRARYLIAGRFERAVEEKPRRRALPKTSDLTERASRDVESPGVPSRSRLNVDARAGAKRGETHQRFGLRRRRRGGGASSRGDHARAPPRATITRARQSAYEFEMRVARVIARNRSVADCLPVRISRPQTRRDQTGKDVVRQTSWHVSLRTRERDSCCYLRLPPDRQSHRRARSGFIPGPSRPTSTHAPPPWRTSTPPPRAPPSTSAA